MRLLTKLATIIDEGFSVLKTVRDQVIKHGPISTPFEGDAPGMHTTCFCLDFASGEEIWTSTLKHPIFGSTKYPAIAATLIMLDDRIVLRDGCRDGRPGLASRDHRMGSR